LRATGSVDLSEFVDSDYDSNTRVTALAKPHSAASEHGCLVVIYAAAHADLGRRYVLDKSVTSVGRGRDNDIVLPSDCVSRRHSRIERRGGEDVIVDLASTNGTYINDEAKPVRERRLQRGDQIRIGDIIFKYLSGSDIELQYHEIVFRMAVTDGLTNLANRKQLDTILSEEIPRARRHGRELSLLMLDIDHFKRINDTHGHLTGDSVLRPTDRLGRYGGEEFCAILPETSLGSAGRIAEELRALVEGYAFFSEDKEIRVTMSAGVGALREGMQPDDLYRAADEKLYEAKRTGRNRVCS
jgi:two-component system, cell cycle response regulator